MGLPIISSGFETTAGVRGLTSTELTCCAAIMCARWVGRISYNMCTVGPVVIIRQGGLYHRTLSF